MLQRMLQIMLHVLQDSPLVAYAQLNKINPHTPVGVLSQTFVDSIISVDYQSKWKTVRSTLSYIERREGPTRWGRSALRFWRRSSALGRDPVQTTVSRHLAAYETLTGLMRFRRFLGNLESSSKSQTAQRLDSLISGQFGTLICSLGNSEFAVRMMHWSASDLELRNVKDEYNSNCQEKNLVGQRKGLVNLRIVFNRELWEFSWRLNFFCSSRFLPDRQRRNYFVLIAYVIFHLFLLDIQTSQLRSCPLMTRPKESPRAVGHRKVWGGFCLAAFAARAQAEKKKTRRIPSRSSRSS